jgi:hypothetical protein
MGWKKDLMKGLVELKGEIARQQGIIVTQSSVIQKQQGWIERLMDRVQAKDFKEFKMLSVPEVSPTEVAGFYEPAGADEDLAGMSVAMEGERLEADEG